MEQSAAEPGISSTPVHEQEAYQVLLSHRAQGGEDEFGGLRIEAPPEAAATLAAVFQGFAQLLQAAAAK